MNIVKTNMSNIQKLEVDNKEENGLKTYPRVDQCYKRRLEKMGKDVGIVILAII